ncbi:MAG: hypothetical protein ACHQYO_07215, partial [Halanaerobiales bacterium]
MRFKDPDGDNVSVAVTSEPVYLARIYNESTGIFSWVASEAGNHWIKFSGFDGEATANRTVYINVDNGEDDSNGNGLDDNGSGDNDAEVNHPPIFEKIGNKIKSPGETLSFEVSVHDPDGIDKNNIRYEV